MIRDRAMELLGWMAAAIIIATIAWFQRAQAGF